VPARDRVDTAARERYRQDFTPRAFAGRFSSLLDGVQQDRGPERARRGFRKDT